MSDLSRRRFLQFAAAASAIPLWTEADFAAAQTVAAPVPGTEQGVFLNFNENPYGPGTAARRAIVESLAASGRYRFPLIEAFTALRAETLGVPADCVAVFSGSSEPLHYAVLAHTGTNRGLVVADPTFEAAAQAAAYTEAPVAKIAVNAEGAHDVPAMLAASGNAGLIIVCNPNNPTGSVTPRAAIEQLLAELPKQAILLVDEAYIELSDQPSVVDLVVKHDRLIVLRTFSKLYGMAGLRLGVAIAQPQRLAELARFGGGNPVPVTAVAAGIASLKDMTLVPSRKARNATVREATVRWLKTQGYAVTPSESNCFLIDTRQPGKAVAAAMAKHQVFIGRSWPSWPNWVRLTVGTSAEMQQFQRVFATVMASPVALPAITQTTPERWLS
jgi:histidinol-phosphate aminotransferase